MRLYHDLDASRAVEALDRAQSLDPKSSETLHAYGMALAGVGRFPEAMRAMRRAVELDPVSPNLTFDGWLVAYMAREFGTSREWCDDFARLSGANGYRCYLLSSLGAGQVEQAGDMASRFLAEQAGGESFAAYGPGRRTLEAYWAWDLERRSRAHLAPGQQAFGEARALAQLGRPEEAIERLRFAVKERAPETVFMAHLPYFDPLAGHPGFAEVVRSVGNRRTAALGFR